MSAKMSAKISDVLRNHVKEKLTRGEVVASMTVRLIRGIEIARIAKTAGFDSLYVDMEHSSFSLETMGQICIAALEVGITPFVRVPGLADVQRILDAGALGIIAPHVSSAAEARDYVKAAKYPPLGERSNAGNLPHLQYRSFPAAEAYAAIDAATMVIVRQASRRRRLCHARRPGGEICALGRTIRFDRHRLGLPACRLRRQGERGTGHGVAMTAATDWYKERGQGWGDY
jgi:hypothetical protein